jgi:hypothetical protein
MKTVVISQPMYFPWVGMFEQMRLADVYVHLDDAQFSKGGFFNRVQFKTQQGTPWLTAPLAANNLGLSLNETQLATTGWQRKHFTSLQQAYSKAPHVEEMLALVDEVFAEKTDSLAALGAMSMEKLAEYFEIKPGNIRWSSRMNVTGEGSARVMAICQTLGAERYITGHGARNYLDHKALEAAGVRVEYMNYEKRPYSQLHDEFTPFISTLDLVANRGRLGREVIVSSSVYWRDYLR